MGSCGCDDFLGRPTPWPPLGVPGTAVVTGGDDGVIVTFSSCGGRVMLLFESHGGPVAKDGEEKVSPAFKPEER